MTTIALVEVAPGITVKREIHGGAGFNLPRVKVAPAKSQGYGRILSAEERARKAAKSAGQAARQAARQAAVNAAKAMKRK